MGRCHKIKRANNNRQTGRKDRREGTLEWGCRARGKRGLILNKVNQTVKKALKGKEEGGKKNLQKVKGVQQKKKTSIMVKRGGGRRDWNRTKAQTQVSNKKKSKISLHEKER